MTEKIPMWMKVALIILAIYILMNLDSFGETQSFSSLDSGPTFRTTSFPGTFVSEGCGAQFDSCTSHDDCCSKICSRSTGCA